MGKMSLNDFIHSGRRSEILNLKELKKITVYIHPKQGFFCIERRRHVLPILRELKETGYDEREKSTKKIGLLFSTCPDEWDLNGNRKTRKCILCNFIQNLREDDSIAMDDVVFQINLGKHESEYLKGEIIGDNNFDYKKSSVARLDYVTSVINLHGEQKVLRATKTLGDSMKSEIENRIQEEGEEDGNPLANPYPLTLKYDESKSPMNRYTAHFSTKTPSDEVKSAFKSEPLDLKFLMSLKNLDEVEKNLKAIVISDWKKLVGRSIPDNVEEEEEEEAPKVKKKLKTKSKFKKKKTLKAKEKEEDLERCPACKKMIPAEAMTCKYCGSEFEAEIPDDEQPF